MAKKTIEKLNAVWPAPWRRDKTCYCADPGTGCWLFVEGGATGWRAGYSRKGRPAFREISSVGLDYGTPEEALQALVTECRIGLAVLRDTIPPIKG